VFVEVAATVAAFAAVATINVGTVAAAGSCVFVFDVRACVTAGVGVATTVAAAAVVATTVVAATVVTATVADG